MEVDVLDRLKKFSLSQIECQGLELEGVDVQVGIEEGNRSLIGRVFGEKKANFMGVKSTMLKLWQHRGLIRVVSSGPNTFQFIFAKFVDREDIMQGRPWFFDNQLMVLQLWSEELKWEDESFNFSPLWIQIEHIPQHWLSIVSGQKIGRLVGKNLDVLVGDSGGKAGKFLKILSEVDLTKPLLRGTMLKYNKQEC